MNKGFAARLKGRRKQGPSSQEKSRGPNTGAWEKTNFALRRDQGHKTGIKDPDRFVRARERNYRVD